MSRSLLASFAAAVLAIVLLGAAAAPLLPLAEASPPLRVSPQNLLHRRGRQLFGDDAHRKVTSIEELVRLSEQNRGGKNRGGGLPPFSLTSLPKVVDWRKNGYVNTPINEGQCTGMSQADAEASIMSSILAIMNQSTSPAVPLSYQELIDCALGCTAAYPPSTGFDWMLNHNSGKIATAASYVSKTTGNSLGSGSGGGSSSGGGGAGSKCNANGAGLKTGATLKKVHFLPKNEKEMAFAVALWGPIIVDIDALALQLYSPTPAQKVLLQCPANTINDIATLVGYNNDEVFPYWILRNVWGTEWGLDGYAYISFGNNSCGITSNPTTAELVF